MHTYMDLMMLLGYKMNKRVGGLREFEFESLSGGHALHATLAISGWLSDEQPGQ
jgi:hypothetical protein